jgi:transcription elongation factor GreA
MYLTPKADKLQAELGTQGPRERSFSACAPLSDGDLSENADYHKAKEDQAFLEGRIQEIEAVLRTAVVVEKTHSDVVTIGSTVTVQEESFDPETYYVVGAKEADPRHGKISNESPIGRALMDHKVGDVVEAETPGGKLKIKILKIE